MKKKQSGFMLLEIIVVLALVGLAVVLINSYISSGIEQQRESLSAQHMRRIVTASDAYIADNAATLLATATPTTPVVVTVATLKTAKYLPDQTPVINVHGQGYEIRVLEPQVGQLSALIVTTPGELIAEGSLRRIARQIGAEGGYVSSQSDTEATGSYSAWTMSLATYGAATGGGRVAAALFFRDGQQISDFMYRGAVAGRPELNTMAAPLNMGNNAITNVSTLIVGGPVQGTTLTASGRLNAFEYVALAGIVTPATSCTPNGLLARQPSGRLASCVSGIWVGY